MFSYSVLVLNFYRYFIKKSIYYGTSYESLIIFHSNSIMIVRWLEDKVWMTKNQKSHTLDMRLVQTEIPIMLKYDLNNCFSEEKLDHDKKKQTNLFLGSEIGGQRRFWFSKIQAFKRLSLLKNEKGSHGSKPAYFQTTQRHLWTKLIDQWHANDVEICM